ncbi:MAG: KTSC domain-containing protein [Acidobacteria bacterium]|nr:KTSC domain-containing protein [Acidobacteriota bacterium]
MATLIPVDSSMIDAVGYDKKTKELEVLFSSGKTYCYKDVPLKVYKELMDADSKGSYMRDAIIDVYSYHQVKGKRRK